jgi:hypothetical protein
LGFEVRADATLHFAIAPGPFWIGYYCSFFLLFYLASARDWLSMGAVSRVRTQSIHA